MQKVRRTIYAETRHRQNDTSVSLDRLLARRVEGGWLTSGKLADFNTNLTRPAPQAGCGG